MTTRAEFEQRRHELANHMLEHPGEFDIGVWGHRTPCGTTGCIAGTAAFLGAQKGLVELEWYGDEDEQLNIVLSVLDDDSHQDMDDWAQSYLGLTSTTMFYEGTLNSAEKAAKALLDAPYVEDAR